MRSSKVDFRLDWIICKWLVYVFMYDVESFFLTIVKLIFGRCCEIDILNIYLMLIIEYLSEKWCIKTKIIYLSKKLLKVSLSILIRCMQGSMVIICESSSNP